MDYEFRDYPFYVMATLQDTEGFLRPSAYLGFFQQAGGLHSEEYGIGNPTMLEQGKAWVVNKNRVRIFKFPKNLRKVITRTWPQTEEKVSCIRNYELFVDDEIIAVGSSRWCVIDVEKKFPVKVPQNMFPNPKRDESPFKDGLLNIKLEAKNELEFVKNFEVLQIFCDISHHLNNANYMEFIFEILNSKEFLIEEFQIDYINQCYKGSNLEIYKKVLDNGWIYVAGYVGDTLIFKSVNKLCKI